MLYCYIHKLSELPKLKKYFSFPSVVLCFPNGESILLVYIYFVVIVVLSEKNTSQSVIVLKEIKLN